ncbi:MAG: hypothetical protein WC101_03190 [Candidatus Gracilibacteria bacterium]
MKTTQKLKIGFIANAIEHMELNPESPSFDSTWQLIEFGKKKYDVRYILDTSIQSESGKTTGLSYEIAHLKAKEKIINEKREDLSSFDILIIRRDPPFNQAYLAMVQILSTIEDKVTIINRPSALTKYNEKINVILFPEYAPKSLVTCSVSEIKHFIHGQKNGVVLKGLDNKGGSNIFMLKPNDVNTNEIIHQITNEGTSYIMCQELLNIEKTGDKRITIINGKVMGGFLRRPTKGDFRGNIGKGAAVVPAQATAKEEVMAKKIGEFFLNEGISIVGIDVIDGKVTEINITSPLMPKRFIPKIETAFYEYIEQLCQRS